MKVRDWVPVAVLGAVCAALWLVPPPPRLVDDTDLFYRARVVETDERDVAQTGFLEYGTQRLSVEMLGGPGAGKRYPAVNELRAQIELDKKFKRGDILLVTWPAGGPAVGDALVARDHWRLGCAAGAFAAFALVLVLFAGTTGAKALFSFVFSCLTVWKLLVPLCLLGWPAEGTTLAVVTVLTVVILFLVAGATRKGLVACVGALLGVASSLALARVLSPGMHITGLTLPLVQTLLHGGCDNLDLRALFNGAVILAASGAVMDLAMDIAAGMDELVRHQPSLSRAALFRSGIRIGRAVVGTMTTTLLLAYSGGYLTLLMVFAAQGTSPLAFLNSTLVSAELVKTLVGSLGLVLVAPFTALVGAWVYARRPRAR